MSCVIICYLKSKFHLTFCISLGFLIQSINLNLGCMSSLEIWLHGCERLQGSGKVHCSSIRRTHAVMVSQVLWLVFSELNPQYWGLMQCWGFVINKWDLGYSLGTQSLEGSSLLVIQPSNPLHLLDSCKVTWSSQYLLLYKVLFVVLGTEFRTLCILGKCQ